MYANTREVHWAKAKYWMAVLPVPWHGYQYLPHNGQSPPPFQEKVNTYDVKVVEGKVWLNPKPFAEGTERQGAMIK